MSNIIVNRKALGQAIHSNLNGIYLDNTSDRKIAEMEMTICNRIGAQLVKYYPGREWKLICDIGGGMIVIACDSLAMSRGYFLHLKNRTMVELEKRAVKVAGEILERFGVLRSRKVNEDEIESVKRDFQGEAITSDAIPLNIAKGKKDG